MGIKYDYLAWQFNRAVSYYGQWVDSELAKTNKEGKPIRTLKDIIENGKRKPATGGLANQLRAIFGNAAAIKP